MMPHPMASFNLNDLFIRPYLQNIVILGIRILVVFFLFTTIIYYIIQQYNSIHSSNGNVTPFGFLPLIPMCVSM